MPLDKLLNSKKNLYSIEGCNAILNLVELYVDWKFTCNFYYFSCFELNGKKVFLCSLGYAVSKIFDLPLFNL